VYKERHAIANGLALANTIDYRLKPSCSQRLYSPITRVLLRFAAGEGPYGQPGGAAAAGHWPVGSLTRSIKVLALEDVIAALKADCGQSGSQQRNRYRSLAEVHSRPAD
jgi:hypothetical protein